VTASEGFVPFRGHRTWYRVVGDLDSGRPPLLCLHGGPGSTHNYFAPLEALAGERAVVVYDQLGCGSSDRPTDVEWSLELFRDEVEAVRDHLGLEWIHLLGTSWGGMLALEHALNGDSAGLVSLVLSSTLASAAEWQVAVQELRDSVSSDEELDDRHAYRGPERPEIVRMHAERGKDVYEAMWGPNEWTITGALAGWDVRPRLGEIDVPTLVVRGAYDMSTPAVSATLVAGIPGAREVVMEQSSHMPVLEETERYLEVVGGFLREVDAAAD
jgi:pimeloyl-ACP methyl ester carboxylesterase